MTNQAPFLRRIQSAPGGDGSSVYLRHIDGAMDIISLSLSILHNGAWRWLL